MKDFSVHLYNRISFLIMICGNHWVCRMHKWLISCHSKQWSEACLEAEDVGRFTVAHRPPFICQTEVLCFATSWLLPVNFSPFMTVTCVLIKQTYNPWNWHINILGARARLYLLSYIITFWVAVLTCKQELRHCIDQDLLLMVTVCGRQESHCGLLGPASES